MTQRRWISMPGVSSCSSLGRLFSPTGRTPCLYVC
ncbi:hypothetical protein CsSME_00002504 [Camellia sinensis var. sinensis]